MVGKILGPDGRPISTADLAREIAMPTEIGVRAVSREGVASGLSPEGLAALLREAAGGQARRYLTLAEEMEERYLHYASQLQTRRLAIEAIAPAVVVPDGVPAAIGDAVHGLVDGAGFREMVGELTDGIAKGYSAVELIWDYTGGLLRPISYTWRDPRFFQFDRVKLTELRLAVDGNLDGEPLPPGKFIVHMPRSKMGIPLRRGVARPAAWAFMLQSFSLKDWAAFSEVYGMPLRIGRYPVSSSPDDIRTLLRAVRSIASDAAAVIPMGMELEFAKVEGQHGTSVFGGLLDYIDKQVSKLVLGQTMSSDDGGSLAQAKVHNEVRGDILRADGRQVGSTVRRDLVAMFVAVNFGPQEIYPDVGFPVAEPEDVAALTDGVSKLVPLGLRVGQREVRSKLGLSDPEDNEELLVARAEPVAASPGPRPALPPAPAATHAGLRGHVAGCRCGGCLARLAADPVDPDAATMTDALLSEAARDWREITDPLLAPIAAAMAGAGSLDDALAAIGRRGPDGSQLLERLAVATATARGIGSVAD
ncbi:DUF935 domain-containing protein [Methylobacterium aquaticum]|nr:DUF935 domain-containing protein [Methylobacterium aquaticum]